MKHQTLLRCMTIYHHNSFKECPLTWVVPLIEFLPNYKYLPTHPPMTCLPTMASYLPIHNPLKYYTFTQMYNIYILHIIHVGKGD